MDNETIKQIEEQIKAKYETEFLKQQVEFLKTQSEFYKQIAEKKLSRTLVSKEKSFSKVTEQSFDESKIQAELKRKNEANGYERWVGFEVKDSKIYFKDLKGKEVQFAWASSGKLVSVGN